MSTQTTPIQSTMINFTIDGRALSVPKGTTVFNAAKQIGIEIPIFCYQDRMPPFGACRMCLVEVEKMPKLQTSCTLEATEGMVVKVHTANAVKGREDILEFLLINHPLDCPICDRGGECPLQDQTLKYGPGLSRFFENKRRFVKAYPLGPVLMLDRERCIVCARCTRFSDIIAGDNALEFIERGYKTEVGTPDGKPADSKFIGNTIMLCPVGALTSEVYRFRARPWDNHAEKSTCTLCPVGCSLYFDSRDGQIMRTRSRENSEVNDLWLCDKGWFGYEFINHPERLTTPLIRRSGKLEPAGWDEALSLVAAKINEGRPQGRLAGLGGNPLTTEENFLFQKLMREGAGVDNVDHRVGTPIIAEDEFAPGMEMKINELEKLSYAILAGIDLTEEFPVLWLRLRQSINNGAKVIFIGHYSPEIARHLTKTILHAPGNEVDAWRQNASDIKALVEEGKKGAIFVGRQYLYSPNRRAILSELSQFRKANQDLTLNIMDGVENSAGARIAGMRPDQGPLGIKLDRPGLDTIKILERAGNNGWDFIYVAGANPAAKYPTKFWNDARAKLGFLVVQDLFLTETAKQADVVLPTLSYMEKKGIFINIGGQKLKLLPGKEIPKGILSDAEIFTRLAQKLNLRFESDVSFLEGIQKEDRSQKTEDRSKVKAEESQKTEARSQKNVFLATFAPKLFDHGVRMKHNAHVVQLAKEPNARIRTEEGKNRGIKDGDTVRLSTNGNTISAKVKLDDGVAEGTIVLPLGFEELPVHELGVNLLNGMALDVSK